MKSATSALAPTYKVFRATRQLCLGRLAEGQGAAMQAYIDPAQSRRGTQDGPNPLLEELAGCILPEPAEAIAYGSHRCGRNILGAAHPRAVFRRSQ